MASGNRRPADTASARQRGQGRGPSARPGRREDRRPAGGPGASGPRQSTRPTPAATAGGRSGGATPAGGSRWPAGGPFARRSTRRLAALGAVFVLLAIMIVPTLRAYLQQRAEYASLTEQVGRQQQSLSALQGQLERWDDPAYVEQQARERLKFVRPGETSYQVIGAEKLLGDSLAGRSRVVVPHQGDDSIPWYGKMWSSIVIADRPDVDDTVQLTPVGERPATGTGEGSLPTGTATSTTPSAGSSTSSSSSPSSGSSSGSSGSSSSGSSSGASSSGSPSGSATR